MQVTEKFYSVLWWSKNACQFRFGSPAPWPGLGYQRDITETLRGALEINDCPRRSCSRSERMVHTVLSKIFWYRRDVVMSRWYSGGRATEPLLARILTPQHIVKFFCHLYRLSYYVVMLQYFFRILFSSLCCAVTGFVAGNIRGVLFDTFCSWACNSPYFISIFLLTQTQTLRHIETLQYSLLHRSCCWVTAIFVMRNVVAAPAEKCFTKTLDKWLYVSQKPTPVALSSLAISPMFPW